MALQSAEERYKEPLEKLVKYGNFSIVDGSVDGMKNLNPKKRAQRKMFLTESRNKKKRIALKNRLKEWQELLTNSEQLEDILTVAQEKVNSSEALLNKNIKNALEETHDLEKAYRTVNSFFKNTKTEKIKNITILNASLDQLSNPDMELFRNEVKRKLEWSYGRVGKKDNYSIMCVPGFLGDNSIVSEWAEIAADNKVVLFTDFMDLPDHENVIEEYEQFEYPDAKKTNIVMTCNWLVGRKAMTEVGEEESLYIPPSAALAGMTYNPNVPLSQPKAGVEYGQMAGVSGVRFPLLQEHIGNLDQRGLVPIINEFGTIMPYSYRTLFNGSDVGLQTYSVVMVFDWVGKVVSDFLNRAAFQNASGKMLNDYRKQVANFLNSIKGQGKLIQDFKIDKFEQDKANGRPDRILVHIILDPFFAAKSFAIKMDGSSGEGIDGYKWKTDVEEV